MSCLNQILNQTHDPEVRTLRPSGMLASEAELAQVAKQLADFSREYPVAIVSAKAGTPPLEEIFLTTSTISQQEAEDFVLKVAKQRNTNVERFILLDSYTELK